MTSELNSESYTRLNLSPEDAKVHFERNAGVEVVKIITALIEACEEHHDVVPTFKSSGGNVIFYYFHKKDDWKTKEKFNLLQINTSGELKDTQFLQFQCNRNGVADKAVWVNHWNGLGRISGYGLLTEDPSELDKGRHSFKTESGDLVSFANLLGQDSEHIAEVASHLAETASNIKKSLSE